MWTDEQKKLLVRLIVEGRFSFSQMAEIINKECSTKYSRNAIIGRAHRCGFSNPRPLPKLSAQDRLERKRERERIRKRKQRFKGKQEASKVIDFHCESVEPRHVAFADLGDDDCRYPYGTDSASYTFCAHPAYPNKPYCVSHLLLCEPTVFNPKRRTAA